MNNKHKSATMQIIYLLCVVVLYQIKVTGASLLNEDGWGSYLRQGYVHFQNKETEKAVSAFKVALSVIFPEVASTQTKESEKSLRARFDDEASAALARYKLGLIYESQGDVDKAAILFRDALTVISTKGAAYLGYKSGCKSCHYKEWKSWKDTKMAKAFETLRPGVHTETKLKYNLDPEKDYTEDPSCLSCHATGFGLLAGYVIPRGAKYKIREASKELAGGTCETCHGPGSKYGPIHKDVDDRQRSYTQEEFYAAGEYRVDEWICMKCHNQRNPTAGPDLHFDFKTLKDKDTHENSSLIYRLPDSPTQAPADLQSKRSRP